MIFSTPFALVLALVSPEPIDVPTPEPIAGLVVDAQGQPVAGAEVFLAGGTVTTSQGRRSGTGVLWRGRSDPQGRFTATWPNEDAADRRSTSGTLLAYRPGAGPAGRRVFVPSAAPPDEPIPIVLRPAAGMPIRVLGPDAKPVAGAGLRVTAMGKPAGVLGIVMMGLQGLPDELSDRFSTTTDADGRARLT
jgi:hypothetical protein